LTFRAFVAEAEASMSPAVLQEFVSAMLAISSTAMTGTQDSADGGKGGSSDANVEVATMAVVAGLTKAEKEMTMANFERIVATQFGRLLAAIPHLVEDTIFGSVNTNR
jgi:hypothetical protein